MYPKAKFALSTLAIVTLGLVGTSFPVAAEDVPGALAVEWEGKKPCEKLFEDEHIRVARCTSPRVPCMSVIPTAPTSLMCLAEDRARCRTTRANAR